jgi:hypothetical protein
MTISKANYISLITSEYQNSTKLLTWLSDLFQPVQEVCTLLEGFDVAFDIDSAVGPQLDVVGAEVGLSRRLETVIYSSDVGFTWDDPDLGWGVGIWIYASSTTLLDLPDDIYRQALKVKIADNYWDGSIPHMYEMWESLFGDTLLIEIQNNLDMTMFVLIYGDIASYTLAHLFLNDQISIRPAGVDIGYHINPTGHPFFAWGIVHLPMFAGWDEGYWSAGGYLDPFEIEPVVEGPPWFVLPFEDLTGEPTLYDQRYSIGPTLGSPSYGGNYELDETVYYSSPASLKMGSYIPEPPPSYLFHLPFDGTDGDLTWVETGLGMTPTSTSNCAIDNAQFHGGATSLLIGPGIGQFTYEHITGIDDNSFEVYFYYRFPVAPTSEVSWVNFNIYAHAAPLYQSNIQILVDGTNVNIGIIEADGNILVSNIVANPNPQVDVWHTLHITSTGSTITISSEDTELANATSLLSQPLQGMNSLKVENYANDALWVDDISIMNVTFIPV